MFNVQIKTEVGDVWAWANVNMSDAQSVWELLGQPGYVELKSTPVKHGELIGPGDV